MLVDGAIQGLFAAGGRMAALQGAAAFNAPAGEAWALGATLVACMMGPTMADGWMHCGAGWLICLLLRHGAIYLVALLQLWGAPRQLALLVAELVAVDPAQRLVDLHVAHARMQIILHAEAAFTGSAGHPAR